MSTGYLCCFSYEDKLNLGMILHLSEEFGDYNINFLEGRSMYKFPKHVDQCGVKSPDALSILSQLDIKPRLGEYVF